MKFVLDLQSHIYPTGILTWKGDICRSWGPPSSKSPSERHAWVIVALNSHLSGINGYSEEPRSTRRHL